MIKRCIHTAVSLLLLSTILLSSALLSVSEGASASRPPRNRCLHALGIIGTIAVTGGSVTMISHLIGSGISRSDRIKRVIAEERVKSHLSRSDREAVESRWASAKNPSGPEAKEEIAMSSDVIAEQERNFLSYATWRKKLSRLQSLDEDTAVSSGKLSKLWAQEFVGSDLIQTDSVLLSNSGAKVAILDSGFLASFIPSSRVQAKIDNRVVGNWTGESRPEYWHGTAVANLIVGPFVGTSPNAVITFAHGYSYDGIGNTETKQTFAQVFDAKPQIMNFSRALDSSEKYFLGRLISAGIIPIVATGNVTVGGFFGRGEDTELQESNLDAPGILVANLDQFGMPYRVQGGVKASVSGPSVFIGAPSGYGIQTISVVNYSPRNEGLTSEHAPIQIQSFGGTSGAAPVVTGSVSNLLSLVPELTYDEVRMVIEKTALRTLNSQAEPRVHGVGMINALKLVEVGKRLKAMGFPKNGRAVLADTRLYDFRAEAGYSFEVAQKAFARGSSNEDKEAALGEMRRAFLLDQTETSRMFLVSGYEEIGRSDNADFYRMLNPDFNAALHYGLNSDVPRIRASSLAMAERIGMRALPALQFNANHPDVQFREQITSVINRLKMGVLDKK